MKRLCYFAMVVTWAITCSASHLHSLRYILEMVFHDHFNLR